MITPAIIHEVRWLTCRIDKGMFSDERAVTYPATSGDSWQKSVFVPSDVVEGAMGGVGRVRVTVFCRNGNTVAVLPSADRDLVTVNEGDISST